MIKIKHEPTDSTLKTEYRKSPLQAFHSLPNKKTLARDRPKRDAISIKPFPFSVKYKFDKFKEKEKEK